MPNLDKPALRSAVAYADRWLAFRREHRHLPGLVVAVRYEDELLLSSAHGFARLDPPEVMTRRHIFRIASHSKTFTATAIMQLVERGLLRLDDRASTHIAWLRLDITIRQLMNHVGGIIRDGVDADFWELELPFPDLASLRGLASDFEIQPASATFKYSNIGYALLGLVVESVSGVPYNQYVKEQIVDRLGLKDTGPEFDPRIVERMVTGYTGTWLGVPGRAVPNIDTHALSPATGFYSTAEDLCSYGAAHWFGDDRLVSDASKREMQHPYWSVEQSEDRYGLGLSVQQIGERVLVGHGGGFPGQSTRTLIDPKDQLVVVVLSNSNAPQAQAAPLAAEIIRIIDFAQDRARTSETGAEGDKLEKYTGRFANIGGVSDIAALGNTLVQLSPEADDPVHFVTDLEIVGPDRLRIARSGGYASAGESVQYERDEKGDIQRVVIAGITLYPEDIFRERYGG